MNASITIRFYEELNDYLAGPLRKRDIPYRFRQPTTVGAAVEALGVPTAEVDLVLVNGVAVDFGHLLKDGDRLSVYPIFERLDISGVTRVRETPLMRSGSLAQAQSPRGRSRRSPR